MWALCDTTIVNIDVQKQQPLVAKLAMPAAACYVKVASALVLAKQKFSDNLK